MHAAIAGGSGSTPRNVGVPSDASTDGTRSAREADPYRGIGTVPGWTAVTCQARARAAASDKTVANLIAWVTTGAPSPSWLTRRERSSAVSVPE
jgi:hypothetical protein